MPLIQYSCKCGASASKFYRVAKEAPRELVCPRRCEGGMKKQLSAPSSTSVITIDNGVQAKSVDVNLDVIKSNEENSTKDFREK